MIVLFSDFGLKGPYIGQMTAAVLVEAPNVRVVNLMSDAPAYDPNASAYLLASLVSSFPERTVFLCVVDPGVGSQRKPLVIEADNRFFVGPDNGLLAVAAKRAKHAVAQEIVWEPEELSETFHGRDLFAPVAAKIVTGRAVETRDMDVTGIVGWNWPKESEKAVYIDGYGNIVTGVRAENLSKESTVEIDGKRIEWALRFSSVQKSRCFWYENSNGLVEVAAREDSAAKLLGLGVGDKIKIIGSKAKAGDKGRAKSG